MTIQTTIYEFNLLNLIEYLNKYIKKYKANKIIIIVTDMALLIKFTSYKYFNVF